MNKLTYKNHTASINYSANDNCLYGKIDDIDDLVLFEARDVNEIVNQFHKVVDEQILEQSSPSMAEFNDWVVQYTTSSHRVGIPLTAAERQLAACAWNHCWSSIVYDIRQIWSQCNRLSCNLTPEQRKKVLHDVRTRIEKFTTLD